jgi:hypothetical protein
MNPFLPAEVFIPIILPVNIINCLITGNATAGGGAGIWNTLSDVTITNTTIAGNKATSQAGGIGNGSSNPTIQNCIIYGNTGVPASTNSIYNSGSTPIVNNTLIQGGFAGSNNVNADPLFVSPLSAALAPTSGGNYQIQKCSPALNGGDNSLHSLSALQLICCRIPGFTMASQIWAPMNFH